MSSRLKNKSFDAVAASRKWRIATGQKLSRMTRAERVAFLNQRLATLRAAAPLKTLAHAA
jgi:hypothetical protein